ncbi:sugar-binding transcriptional regulator [Enterococcus olivae]
MGYSDDTRLLVEIASMYYKDGAKQEDIAKKISISRSLVSKYLAKARNLGLVEIIIHDDLVHPYKKLEEQVREKYHLDEVICVPSTGTEALTKRLGTAGSRYLSRVIQPHHTVGVSAGTAVREVAETFSTKNYLTRVKFIPLVGGLGQEHINLQANVLCELFARRCGATAVELHAPITVDTAEAKKIFLEQSFIKRVFDEARKVDISIVGIGGAPVYTTMTKAYLKGEKSIQSDLTSDEIVGDICYNFISKEGDLVDGIWNSRVLSIGFDDLRKIPKKIAVAGGEEKVEGIRAALNGNLVNVLITDEDAAKILASDPV